MTKIALWISLLIDTNYQIQIQVYRISDTDARCRSQNVFIQDTGYSYIIRILDTYRDTCISDATQQQQQQGYYSELVDDLHGLESLLASLDDENSLERQALPVLQVSRSSGGQCRLFVRPFVCLSSVTFCIVAKLYANVCLISLPCSMMMMIARWASIIM